MIVSKGDLFKYTDHYQSGYEYEVYAKLIYIQDDMGNKYDEFDIITGWGEKNTKAFYMLKPICDTKLNELLPKLLKTPNKNGLVRIDIHSAFKVDIEKEISRLEENIDFLNKKILFFKQNHSLEFKLKSLLE
jgi:hypothetical protein